MDKVMQQITEKMTGKQYLIKKPSTRLKGKKTKVLACLCLNYLLNTINGGLLFYSNTIYFLPLAVPAGYMKPFYDRLFTLPVFICVWDAPICKPHP